MDTTSADDSRRTSGGSAEPTHPSDTAGSAHAVVTGTDTPTATDTSTSATSAAPTDEATSPIDPAPTADATTSASDADASAGRRLRAPFRTGFLVTLGALAAVVVGFAIRDVAGLLISIVFALFIALGLNPLVLRLQRFGMRRGLAVLTTVALVLIAFALLVLSVVPTVVSQVAQFVQTLPTMISDFRHSDLYAWIADSLGDTMSTVLSDVQAFLTDPGNIAAIGGGALQLGASVVNSISGLVVVLVLTLYFVAALPQMTSAMYTLAPARSRKGFADLTEQITASVGAYVGGMVVLAAINATLVGLLALVLGLPFALLMAVAALGITLIPMVGSVLFWIIGSGLALFTSPLAALIFAIVYLIYMQVEAYVLTPRIMAKAVSVPGPLVIISAVAGATLLGLLGAFIAIPVAAAGLLIVKRVLIPRQDAKR